MKAGLFTFAAMVSLLFCLAVLVLWVRSSIVCDRLHFAVGDPTSPTTAPASVIAARQLDTSVPWYLFHSYDVESADGSVCFGSIYMLRSQLTGQLPAGLWQSGMPMIGPNCSGGMGFGLGIQGARLSRAVMVPYWALVMLTAPLPIVWYQRILRESRERKKGTCRNCGYDLRATPERCPECGTPAASSGETVQAAEHAGK